MRFWTLVVILALCSKTWGAAPEVVGWRGDGTGVYPKTDPPVTWQQTSKAIEGLRFQSKASSGEGASGTAMPDGVVREWLVLGPVEAGKDTAEGLGSDDQSKVAPVAGAKAAGREWKAITTDTAFIDFAREFGTYGKNTKDVAYAATYVYSPTDVTVFANAHHTAGGAMWVNGKMTSKGAEGGLNYSPQTVALKQGWNRILLRVTPAQDKAERQLSGQWYVNIVFRAVPGKSAFTQKNIKWKTLLPAASGVGAPIAVGGKIFLLSETADLVCVDGTTGKILWVRGNHYSDCATEEEKKANAEVFAEIEPLQVKLKAINDSFASAAAPKLEMMEGSEGYKEKLKLEGKLNSLMKKVDDKKYKMPTGQDVGYSGFTPLSDGKYVWAWFATGVTCCYDLNGKLIWRRLDNEGSFFEHGYSVSPVLADGKLMVFMNKLIAFDAMKGDRVWTTPLEGLALLRFHGTPAVVKMNGGSLAVLPPGHIVRMSDGKIVRDKGQEVSGRQQEIPSPVAIGNTVYELSTFGPFHKVVLPGQVGDSVNPVSVKTVMTELNKYPVYYLDWFMSSPLIHEGLAYCVNNTGVMAVIDVEKMQVVYEKLLDLDQFQNSNEGAGRGVGASPALAGGKIYIVGDAGATLVLKPGRKYEQLAKNKIESIIYRNWQERTEQFVASPTFDGKRMYLRGQRYLYCIGE